MVDMQASVRSYNRGVDYERVGQFLVRTYRTSGRHINWLQPRWEYMHYHPLVHEVDLGVIGVWGADGEIVAAVHPEHRMGTVYVEVDPVHADLKREMLAYAEERLSVTIEGRRFLKIYINDGDIEFREIAVKRGFQKQDEGEPMSHLVIPDSLPRISLPTGFQLKSLAEDDTLWKVHRVLWRGFGHGDEPPDDEIEGRRFMQSAPNFDKDLNVVVEAPDGSFVSYCGMWYEPVHRISYVEPVATDPDFRGKRLGRAAVLEGVRRCGERGATVAYVGSAMPFYQALGFRQVYHCSVWQREWM
jgi:predicted N-acetyltransferase YhbS